MPPNEMPVILSDAKDRSVQAHYDPLVSFASLGMTGRQNARDLSRAEDSGLKMTVRVAIPVAWMRPSHTVKETSAGWFKFFPLIMALLAMAPVAYADSVPSKVKQGNQRYDQKMYEQALQLYSEALQQQPDRRELNYNLANTLYRLDKHREAATELKKAAGTDNNALRRKAAYNLGNALFKANQFQEAADQYTQVLQMDPGDVDAKYNLELALRKIEEQQKQKSQGKDDKQQDRSKQDKSEQDSSQQGKDKANQDPSQENQTQDQQSKQDKQSAGRDDSRQAEGKRPPQDPKGLSRQDAERLLQAMDAKERQELERQLQKVRRGTVQGRDW